MLNLLSMHKGQDPPQPPPNDPNQPYPEKYVAPTFSRFDGRKGSALVHISKFLDSMGAYAGNGDLCFREFSKSLDDRAYTWYTTLPPESVKVWEDMVELFCGKYFQAEEKITLVNLHTTKQTNGEDLLRYIHRFRDISLDCYANYEEGELVGLLQKARKTALSVKPHAEKPKEKKSQPQVLTLPEISKKVIEEDKKNPKFCYFHQYVHHSTADCWTLRRKFHEKIQDGTLELLQAWQKVHIDPFLKHKEKCVVSVIIHGSASDADMDEPVVANSAMTPAAIKTLQRNPRFQSLFNQLGLNPEARTAATEAIMAIAADFGAHCFTTETHATLYDEITPAGEASLAKPIGIPLPKWEEIKDAPEADLRDLLERKKKRKAEASASKSQPQCPSCLTVNATDIPESADTAEAVTADPKISAKEELEVINLSSDPNVHRPVSISASLSVEERMHLVELLKEYQDVFAWQYDEMPGIDPKLVAHSLNVEPGTKPVVQPMKIFHPEVEAHITQEVKKLFSAGFIKPIQHPRWLSNIVPMKKKNGQIRCCVDFRNLNKACPKDEFLLPNMDLLIDSAAGHAMFSFMDGFSGYNQILMSLRDTEKTAFRTPISNFYYTVMPFGLKNAGATYQRTMTAMFHDMMHREIEDYIDDIVVKSKTRDDHFCILKKRGINVDPARASAIATMKPLTTHKELKSFLGKLSYIRRFIPGLAAVQDIMTKLPTICAPILGKPLRLYLVSNSQAIGALIAQENDNGVEQPIYYVSRTLKDAESRYPGAEQSCLALIYASQRLRHYFLAHKVQLMTKSHPIRSLLQRPVLSGRLAQWFLQLLQYEIIAETPIAIKSLADSVWTLKFDGSSTATSAGAGIVLYKDDGEAVTKSFKFDFPCSNNAAEYKTYQAGLAIAYEMGIKHLRVIGDSNLMLSPDQEDWRVPIKAKLMSPVVAADLREIKDYTLISGDLYRRLPGGVLARCISIEEAKERLPEVHEKTCGDGGAISLYRRLQRLGYFWPNMSAEAEKIQSQCPTCQFNYNNEEVCTTFVSIDWRTPFLEYLLEGILPSNPKDVYHLKRLALRYFVEGGTLFRKGFHGEPLRCLSLSESQMGMKENSYGRMWGASREKEALPMFAHTRLITDNGIPFINKDVREVLEHYRVKHRRSTPYYSQGNRQAEAISRMLLRILSKMVFDYGNDWKAHLADVLWAYRSSPKTATGFTPFSLVYGTDTISPTELVVPSPRVMQGSELEVDANICAEARMADLEGLDEARDLVKTKSQRNYQKMANMYNKALRVKIFVEGQMVLKAAEFVRRNLPSLSKFSPNWDGSYIIREAHESGYYRLSKSDGTVLADPINGK
uniref:Integrase catalytic domain-containing protein n=1 Tax=Fagus sylvatica TaxID=28930 RepID=A0A2N9EW19_FAGSY